MTGKWEALLRGLKFWQKCFFTIFMREYGAKLNGEQKKDGGGYLRDAAILPPSTVRTAPVVFLEVAKWKNARATSSALTSFNNKFPFI